MPFVEYIYFVAIGMIAGFSSGLLGIGGGIIIVPLLFVVFTTMGLGHTDVMQHIVATSIASIAFSALISTWHHNKKQGVVWPLLRSTLPGVVLGAIAGAYVAHLISSNLLKLVFGIFLVILAVYLFVRKEPKAPPKRHAHRGSVQSLMGLVIGFIASVLGFGGGIFYVPLFLGYKMPMKNAVGTSAACTFFNALIGAIVYIILGWNEHFPSEYLGYIYLPAFFFICVGSVFSTPLGVKLSHKLSSKLLKKIFSCIVAIVGILMVIH